MDQLTYVCKQYNNFQDSKFIFMISVFKIFPIMLLRFWCILVLLRILVHCRFNSYFTSITKGKLYFSLICSFYCWLVKKVWGLKVAKQFAIRGLVAYKLVAYKKSMSVSRQRLWFSSDHSSSNAATPQKLKLTRP